MDQATISVIEPPLIGRAPASRIGAGRVLDVSRRTSAPLALPLLWALGAVLAPRIVALPPLLALSVAFASALLFVAAWRWSRGGSVVDLTGLRSPGLASEICSVVGAGVFGLLALRVLLPGSGAVASDAWPVAGAAFAALTGTGIADLATGPGRLPLAAALAVGGALCWVIGAPARQSHGRAAGARRLFVYGIAALACFLLHLCLEPRVAHDAGSLLAAAAIGVGPLGLGVTALDRRSVRPSDPAGRDSARRAGDRLAGRASSRRCGRQ